MRRYLEACERAVGVRREPGSRNVVLDKPWVMDRPLARLEASDVGMGLGGPLSLARALPTGQGLAGARHPYVRCATPLLRLSLPSRVSGVLLAPSGNRRRPAPMASG